jgi:arylsulfatase A-like enzyme
VTATASLARHAGSGLGAGVLAGLVLGLADALTAARGGLGMEAQALWAAPLGWGALFAPLGAAAGLALGRAPLAPGRRQLAKLLAPRVALSLWLAGVFGGAIAARYAPVLPPSAPPVPASLADAPNLLLVVVGALRADALACAGSPGAVPAPALCRIAADGTRFDGFGHAASTRPAVATLLTSLFPSRHGATGGAALPDAVETLAEALAARGYATGAVVASPALGPESGLAQGFAEYHAIEPAHAFGAADSSARLMLHRLLRWAGAIAFPGLRAEPLAPDADAVHARAFAFLERHRASRFFLFLHYADALPPYERHPYDGAGKTGAGAARRALYQGEIAYLDGRFARLLGELEALGLYGDAVIVLAGDHGTELGERSAFGHGRTLHDEQLRVPLFVKWRGGERLAPPAQLGAPARLLDVAPTLLARAGAPAPAAMQGVDLAADPSQRRDADRVVFAEEDGLRAVRTARWKWIEAAHGLPERALFDLAADPGETENVADREPGTWAELRRQAEALQAGGPRGPEGWGPGAPIR